MSTENQLQLQTTCLLSIQFEVYKKDFTFVVNGEEFRTTRFLADLLSPKISQIRQIDPTIDSFEIHTNEKGHFSYILQLINFKANSIPDNEIPFISEVVEILGNENIIFTPSKESNDISIDNVLNLLKRHEHLGRLYSKNLTAEIKFASSYFYELCLKDEINDLCKQTIESIIKNQNLKLTDEDQLLTFINKLYSNDQNFANLYEYVHFENVSSSKIDEFINLFQIIDLTNEVWNRLSQRLKQEMKQEINTEFPSRYNDNGKNSKEFKYSEGQEFDGIMKYLTNKSGSNIHDNGTINITSNSIRYNSEHPKNLVDYNNVSSQYYSRDNGDAFISFDFKNRKIQLSEYSIKTNSGGENNCHLKNWSIDVSNDGNSWIEVDRHINDSSLRGKNFIKTFKVQKNNSFYRFVRLRQTGNTWYTAGNCNEIWFVLIEFFGKLQEPI